MAASSWWGACTWPTAREIPTWPWRAFLANGGVDPGFGFNGTERIDFAHGVCPAPSTVATPTRRWTSRFQGDGKILVAGTP